MKGERQEVGQFLNSIAAPTFRNAAHQAALRQKLAATQTRQATVSDDTRHLSLGRRAARTRWIGTAAAVAACLAIAALVGLWPREPLVQSAYAQLVAVAEKSKKAQWIHIAVSADRNGHGEMIDTWACFRPWMRIYTRADSSSNYSESETGRSFTYYQPTGVLTVTDYLGPYVLPEKAENALDFMMSNIRSSLKEGRHKLVTSRETINGRLCTVYALKKSTQGARQGTRVERVAAVDAEKNRVVRIWSGGVAADVDYPATGPESIYDLGVPRDAKVVDERTRDEQSVALFWKSMRAAEQFEKRLYAVVFHGILDDRGHARGTRLEILYEKDGMFRYGLYEPDVERGMGLWGGEDLEELEVWAEGKVPSLACVGADVESGVRVYKLTDSRESFVRRLQKPDWRPPNGEFAERQWALNIEKYGKGTPSIPGLDGELPGTGWIKPRCESVTTAGYLWARAERWTFYVNPQRDHLVHRSELWVAKGDESWVPQENSPFPAGRKLLPPGKTTTTVQEYAQTPAGNWYARKKLTEREDENGKVTKTVQIIHLDTTREIPDDVFDWRQFEAQLPLPVRPE